MHTLHVSKRTPHFSSCQSAWLYYKHVHLYIFMRISHTTHMHTLTLAQTHTHLHSHKHTCTHTYTRTNTHIYVHIQPAPHHSGLYLQDLTFIEMQPSLLEDKTSINFTKKWKQFKSVDHIRFSQTKYVMLNASSLAFLYLCTAALFSDNIHFILTLKS